MCFFVRMKKTVTCKGSKPVMKTAPFGNCNYIYLVFKYILNKLSEYQNLNSGTLHLLKITTFVQNYC
jgi:hypothetical protein